MTIRGAFEVPRDRRCSIDLLHLSPACSMLGESWPPLRYDVVPGHGNGTLLLRMLRLKVRAMGCGILRVALLERAFFRMPFLS